MENSKWVMRLCHAARDDFLFVPAGLPHRFTDFDDTMSTWVMFYGPNGDENVKSTERTS
jgi:uncharacterized RmlC-like cupin family protein